MTNGQVIVAAFILLGFFAVLAGLIVLLALFFNDLAYRWEARHGLPRQIAALEDALALDLADRCNVVRLHSATVDQIRPRRGPAA